jgi:hypothetical protein
LVAGALPVLLGDLADFLAIDEGSLLDDAMGMMGKTKKDATGRVTSHHQNKPATISNQALHHK